MRHVWSLIAGMVIAPLAWLLMAYGQEQSSATMANLVRNETFNTANLVKPVILLAVAGLIVGLIATLRTSPLGALIAGLFYAGAYLAFFVQPWRVHSAVPGRLSALGQTVHPRIPLDNGTVLILGLLLLTAVVSVQRWRAARYADAEETAPGGAPEADHRGLGEIGGYQEPGATTLNLAGSATGSPYGPAGSQTRPNGT